MQYSELGILQLYKIDETIALQKHQDQQARKGTGKEGLTLHVPVARFRITRTLAIAP